MVIRVKRSWKEDATGNDHRHLSRRDFISRGLATGTMSLLLPQFLVGDLVKSAMAGSPVCPPPAQNPGGIVQLHGDGGFTCGARFLNPTQASIVAASTNAASRYGISGTAVQKVGLNMFVDPTSMFGKTIMTPMPGFTQAQWSAALAQCSLGGNWGPYNLDDGGGNNTGLLGTVGGLKASAVGKSINIGVNNTLAQFAQGLPSSSVSGNNLTSASLENVFSMTPAGLTNVQTMTNTALASQSLSNAFATLFGLGNRTGASTVMTSANCGFQGMRPWQILHMGNAF